MTWKCQFKIVYFKHMISKYFFLINVLGLSDFSKKKSENEVIAEYELFTTAIRFSIQLH